MPGDGADVDGWLYMFWNTYSPFMNTSVEDASYIYCKEIVLNYNIPRSFLSKLKLSEADVFVKAENVGLIWTANSKNYHPEYLPGIDYVPMTSWQFGLNVKF